MKLWIKGYLIFMTLCIAVISVTGVIITESSYSNSIRMEVQRSLEEEENIHSAAKIYLDTQGANRASMEDYLDLYNKLLNEFGTRGKYLEIITWKKVVKRHAYDFSMAQEAVNTALDGNRNFLLKRVNGTYFLFIANLLERNAVLLLAKDISYIDGQRKDQYMFFIRTELIMLIFLAFAIPLVSRYITGPLEKLAGITMNIASGNYNERIKIKTRDEIGILAEQFNSMAAEIKNKIDELEKQSERKQRFIDSLIHELRTPMTSIIGYADFLRSTKYDEAISYKGLSYINSEGKRVLELVKKLLDMILLQKSELDFKMQNIMPIFEEVKDTLGIKLNEKKIELAIKGEDFEFYIDRDLFKEVVINLVDNSINASEDGDKITLGAKSADGCKIVYVEDEGKGIPHSELEKITEPFYRIEKSRSRKEGGLGLGLSICDEIIKSHHGRLKIESTPGRGTRVEIIFESALD